MIMSKKRSKKYPEKVTNIRGLAKKEIPKILRKKPLTSTFILSRIKETYTEYCDDDYFCQCGKISGKQPEWKHQVRWAIQDLKFNSMIQYDKREMSYSLLNRKL